MKHRVLIVDDSLTVRMDLAEAFEDADFDVVLCRTVAEARTTFRRELPDMVILDVVLPDGDGVELLQELRSDTKTADVPVALLSAEAEIADRIRGLERGADEYVGKPYDSKYVVARTVQLLRRKPQPDDPPTVLVIDDSLTYREELSSTLEASGYRTALARSGEEGLRMAANLRPDAVIVDGVMPGVDGLAFVRRIRLDPGLQGTPCLLLTASEGAASEVLALDSGADAYVRKGEGMDVILARLSATMRSATRPEARSHATSLTGPKRILAVDDSPTFLGEISDQLRADGYEVVKARSGEEALQLLAVEEVDCILLDLLMPGLSGTQTCRQIKHSPVHRNVPLIMLTALEDPAAVIEGMNAGADDYVAKSVDFGVIKARLRAQLRRKQFEDENRRVRDEILRKEAETRAAREEAEARAVLLRELATKNRQLELLNNELQMFAYSVSHDLQQPLRAMDGFSKAALDSYGDQLGEEGRHFLNRIRAGAEKMRRLIDGLLTLSRVTQRPIETVPLRLDTIAHDVIERLREAAPDRHVEVEIAEPLEAKGDPHLVESLLQNLLGNAWKFSSEEESSRIELGVDSTRSPPVYFVRDNGAGFDMEYADTLFAPFQRQHSEDQFPGTGIGLATVRRIVQRHGGEIRAEAARGDGATFYFTLANSLET